MLAGGNLEGVSPLEDTFKDTPLAHRRRYYRRRGRADHLRGSRLRAELDHS